MKNYCFLIVISFVCIFSASFAQTLKIEYVRKGGGCTVFEETVITDSCTIIRNIPEKMECPNKRIIGTISKGFFVKDKRSKSCYYFEEKKYVSDTLHLMKWQLTKSTKEILGFKCKSATTTFRGREYIAYYTEKIPVSDGPWKFGGLPGLILAVEATDGSYKFVAHKIIQNYKPTPDDFEELKLLKTTKFISFQEFANEYKKEIDDFISSMKARKGSDNRNTTRFIIERIEIIHPDANTKGIEY